MLAIVTFPLHPLLGKMLKKLKHGWIRQESSRPCFHCLSGCAAHHALRTHVHSSWEGAFPCWSQAPFTHARQYFVYSISHLYSWERVAFNFSSLFVLDMAWYQGYAALREWVGEYFDFFSVLWKKMCKIRVVASLKVSGRIHTWIHFSLKFSLLECVHYGFTIFIWQRNILFLGYNFSGCGFQIIFSIPLSFHNY